MHQSLPCARGDSTGGGNVTAGDKGVVTEKYSDSSKISADMILPARNPSVMFLLEKKHDSSLCTREPWALFDNPGTKKRNARGHFQSNSTRTLMPQGSCRTGAKNGARFLSLRFAFDLVLELAVYFRNKALT